MFKIPFTTWIANAAACLTGHYGDVTQQAQGVDCSRQTIYDHAQKVQAAVEAEHSGGPTRTELLVENENLQRENSQLWVWLAGTIEFPPCRQHEFSATAAGMGLSLNQILVLLDFLLGRKACPGRSTLHRWVQAAGEAAGRVLKILDARCQALVLVGCLDEIFFHRRPVLVGIEPASMVWFLGQKADDRSGATWAKALHDWTALQFVLADAGSGLQVGIATVQQQRQEDQQTPLENGLDVFHTTQEARRALRQTWNRVEALWEQAEAATRRGEQAQRQGQDARGPAVATRVAWKKAEAMFREYERGEAGWKIAHAAVQVFRPDGLLNDRCWAREQIALALPCLSGREWSKVRGFLQTEESLTFLDRLHRQLHEAVPDEALRGELVHLWWLRRQQPRATTPGAVAGAGHVAHLVQPVQGRTARAELRVAGAGHVAHLVQRVICQKKDAHWGASYRKVARILSQVVRASSAVECMNSVLRMHQSRHRTVTQGLLDLKRLYRNCHAFREGKRRGQIPYKLLGLKLSSYRFWDLLTMPTETVATT